jgi:HPt (histidine-containing phosphotransfer) domain-containing protein
MITDVISLQQMTGHNNDVTREMVELFFTQLDETAAGLESFWNEGNWTELSRLAHKMKSSALIMGVSPIAEEMTELETLAKEEIRPERCRALIDLFHTIADEVKTELKNFLTILI